MICVRRATKNDIPLIMDFLDSYWLKGYALAHNRQLFEWQFVCKGNVNIWIGIDDEQHILYAIQCAIIYRDVPHPDISGSIWLAIKSPEPELAFEVQKAMTRDLKQRTAISPGIKPKVARYFEIVRGKQIVYLDHYYRLADRTDYRIASIVDKCIPKVQDSGYRLSAITTIDEFADIIPEECLISSVPSKDYSYIKWRYFDHPVFHYDIWGISYENSDSSGVLITREEEANDSKVCKIVDFYGEPALLGLITHELDRLCETNGYEYVDVYSYGIDTAIYENGGLIKCDSASGNIIPNHFQPFQATNSDIVMVKPRLSETRIFRGDSDQDKPRLWTKR